MLRPEELAGLADIPSGRVHAHAYTRRDVFEQELLSVFLGSWLFLGLTSELSRPGDFKTVYLADVPVILTREDAGEIVAMLNRCPACGSTVCQQESGNARAFHCSYHDWYFDSRGALAGIDLRLDRLLRVESYRGLIFACLSPTAPDLQRHLGLARHYIDLWADQSPTGEIGVHEGAWKSTYAGNWKLYLQANADGYRQEYLRNQARRDEPPPPAIASEEDTRRAYDLGNGHAFLELEPFNPEWKQSLPSEYAEAVITRVGTERAAMVLGFPDWRLQIFPNLCLTRHSLRVLRPISVEETEVRQQIVRLPETPDQWNRRILRARTRADGPAGHRSQDEFEMLERSQHGFRAAESANVNGWISFSRGLSNQLTGPRGERIGALTSEIGVRAALSAWWALMNAATTPQTSDIPMPLPSPYARG